MSLSIESILADWERDSQISKAHLAENAIGIAKLHSKYTQINAAIRQILNRKRRELKLMKHEKRRWIGGKMSRREIEDRHWDIDPLKGQLKPIKHELEEWVEVDKEVADLIEEISNLEIMEDVTKDIVKKIHGLNWDIRVAVDWEKFVAGA